MSVGTITVSLSMRLKWLLGPFVSLMTIEADKRPIQRMLFVWTRPVLSWDIRQ